jgi:hypothetical protein
MNVRNLFAWTIGAAVAFGPTVACDDSTDGTGGSTATSGTTTSGTESTGSSTSGTGSAMSETDHTFVVSRMTLPTTNAEATKLGVKIDEKTGATVDNQLGSVLAALHMYGVAPQIATDDQVDHGSILLLANVKATGLVDAPSAELSFYEGANPAPPACDGGSDVDCGKHLLGNATFDIAAGSPTDSKLDGAITSGALKAGPGKVEVSVAFAPATTTLLSLQHARAEVVVTADGFGPGSKIGGAISDADVSASVLPGLHQAVNVVIDADCQGNHVPPTCGCTQGSHGAELVSAFDANTDCSVTLDEFSSSALTQSLLAPDVDLDGDGSPDALSFGFGVSAVKATFTPP